MAKALFGVGPLHLFIVLLQNKIYTCENLISAQPRVSAHPESPRNT